MGDREEGGAVPLRLQQGEVVPVNLWHCHRDSRGHQSAEYSTGFGVLVSRREAELPRSS